MDINKDYISPENLTTTTHLKYISDWTNKQKMKLNTNKTYNMVFNFTDKFQFNTRLNIDGHKIDTVSKIKLLGTIITNDLKWEENTKELTKKANMRMCLLRKVSTFKPPLKDLRLIYIQYVRNILEQSCVVWNSSLTMEQSENIERIQKNACRIILKNDFQCYKTALLKLNLETLEERRVQLCLKFALKGRNNPQIEELFQPKNKTHIMELRNTEIIEVKMAHTERYSNSAVPYMQRLINEYEHKKNL